MNGIETTEIMKWLDSIDFIFPGKTGVISLYDGPVSLFTL